MIEVTAANKKRAATKAGKQHASHGLHKGRIEQELRKLLVKELQDVKRNRMAEKRSKLVRAGVSGYNKPKRTPNHQRSHTLL